MKTAIVDNKEVKIGDIVGFKCDYEQYGEIVKIHGSGKRAMLTLFREDGFGDEYNRYATHTDMEAERCWL